MKNESARHGEAAFLILFEKIELFADFFEANAGFQEFPRDSAAGEKAHLKLQISRASSFECENHALGISSEMIGQHQIGSQSEGSDKLEFKLGNEADNSEVKRLPPARNNLSDRLKLWSFQQFGGADSRLPLCPL